MTDKATLNDIAPYPKTAEDATADAMARHLTAFAQLHWRMAMDHPNPEKARQSIGYFSSHYGIAYLLREQPASEGDRVARELWETWESGHGVGIDIWDWLADEYGIDPERINEIAARLIAEDAAKAAETPEVQPAQPVTPASTATNYHESVDHLRRDLMKGVALWEKVADEYKEPADKVQARTLSAALMAVGYGYTLAAIIGYARKYGEHVAHDLAFEADEILTNGDFEDMNKDVAEIPAGGES
jgi:hypothetical protein